MNKCQVERLLGGATAVGYLYLAIKLIWNTGESGVRLCLFRTITDIPCPACGSTRAMLELLHGNFGIAFSYNPISYIQLIFLVVAPALLLYDYARKRQTLFNTYNYLISQIERPRNAIVLISLIIINWIYIIISQK